MRSRERRRNSTEPRGELASRTLAMPADCNPRGDIFGGWIMALMDSAGKMSATPHAGGRVVTVSVSNITFLQPVQVGDELSVGDLTIRALGGRHAVIHPEIQVINNISYLVGDGEHPARLMHPGDALFVPDEPIDVLATPAAAPWMKISEAVDYLRAVAPNRAVPIHQGIIAPDARGIYYGRLTEMTSTDFQVLPEESGVAF